ERIEQQRRFVWCLESAREQPRGAVRLHQTVHRNTARLVGVDLRADSGIRHAALDEQGIRKLLDDRASRVRGTASTKRIQKRCSRRAVGISSCDYSKPGRFSNENRREGSGAQ